MTRTPGSPCSPTTPSSRIRSARRTSIPKAKATAGVTRFRRSGDKAIAPNELEFNFVDTFQCGNEEANVGHIVITTGGYQVTAEGVFTYKANDEGKIVALRAYWEVDRATKSARKV